MIGLKFIGAERKEVIILVHQKIYVRHELYNNTLEIFFKSVAPAKKEDKQPITYTWSFRKAVNEILNYSQVETFLNSMQITDINKPEKPGKSQTTIEF
jgi:hypothetical protein